MNVIMPTEFSEIKGLEIRGILSSHITIQKAKLNGLLWFLGSVNTIDVTTNQPTTIYFKTPYPIELEFNWCLADFIFWVVSHEMMETVSLNNKPLFYGERLIEDHSAHLFTWRELEQRISKTRQRYREDSKSGRWHEPSSTLSKGLGLFSEIKV